MILLHTQASVNQGRERRGRGYSSVCRHLCVSFFICVLHGYVCSGAAKPTWEAMCWHFSLRTRRWILSKSHYAGPNEDAGCENAAAYGFISPPCFLIPFRVSSHFPLTHVWKKGTSGKKKRKQLWDQASQAHTIMMQTANPSLTPECTYTTCDLFLSCTTTWLIANWWAALIHIPSCISTAGLDGTFIVIAEVVCWRKLPPQPSANPAACDLPAPLQAVMHPEMDA